VFPHVSAALQLTEAGKSLVRGILFNTSSQMRLMKIHFAVVPLDLVSEEPDYDTDKYREMLLEAAETILGYFGLDRTIYGDAVQKKYRKWWYDLRLERGKDIGIERDVYDG
jgi:hypothetical protein